MSRRPSTSGQVSGASKRKHLSLSIKRKVELLRKHEMGVSVKRLSEEYGIGTSTVYDLKKQKEQILQFYGESDVPKLMDKRKTLHQSKTTDVDNVLMEWIRQRRSENLSLDRAIIMIQAKTFHNELGLTSSCEYSSGWFNKFQKRRGLRLLLRSLVNPLPDKPTKEEHLDVYTALSDTAAPIRTTTTSVTNTTEEPVTDDGHSMPKSWKRKRTLNNDAKSQSEDTNEMQNKPEIHETFSRVRLKPQKLKENVLQPKSSHDKQLGLDLSFPMLINDIGSFLEIAEKLISDYSTRIKQTVNAHVGASHIIHSPLQKTVGTQTDGRCFCNNIEKFPGRPKAKYEKKVLQSKIEVDMGKNQVQPRRKPSKKRKNVLETSDSENKKDVVKPSHKAPKKTPADSENTPLDVVKPGRRTPKRSKKIINIPSASEISPMDVVLNSRRPRGSIRPIPAWLENQGVAAEALQAVISGLGTEILGVLCARAQPTTARVQLCSLAAQTFTTTMYAELCRFMESCSAPQGSEQAIVSRCRKDVEEMGGSPGVLEIKVEYEDSFPEEKKDLKDADMYFGLSSSTGWR